MQRTATSAIWTMRVVCAPKGSNAVVQKPRRNIGTGSQLSVPWQRVKVISMDGLLQKAHHRTLRNPMGHGASGEDHTGHQEEKATEVGRKPSAKVPSAIQGAGVTSPVRCCTDPVIYEKGLLDLAQEGCWQPPGEHWQWSEWRGQSHVVRVKSGQQAGAEPAAGPVVWMMLAPGVLYIIHPCLHRIKGPSNSFPLKEDQNVLFHPRKGGRLVFLRE